MLSKTKIRFYCNYCLSVMSVSVNQSMSISILFDLKRKRSLTVENVVFYYDRYRKSDYLTKD